MFEAATAVDLLHANARLNREILYLEGDKESRVSFEELIRRAGSILFEMQKQGARRGDKMIIFVANNEQFIQGFWGAVLGGVIPVPVALGISDEHRHKLLRIANKLGKPFLYTDTKTLARLRTFAMDAGESALLAQLEARIVFSDTARSASERGHIESARADDPLFIQFSSGSTSQPKGVVLTHTNVLANARGSGLAAHFSDQDVGLSWMPLTHDMGLVGMHLIMSACAVRQHFMPTELFIRRPLLWMDSAARIKATITTSPNFGFRHFLKVLDERAVDHWDLSSLRLIFNGAEPISRSLCDEFMDRMAPARLKRTAMFPVYGLAEASLAVSFPKPGMPYRSITLDRHRLNVGEAVASIEASDRNAVELMAVGTAIPECEIRLCADDDTVVPIGHVGHLQIRGANVTRGYFDDAATNAQSFAENGWLRTGDLGLRMDDELFITGRAKDIIFINGQNYYPHDLEEVAQKAPGLELNKVVVAGVRTARSPTDELTVFVLHRGSMADFAATAVIVRRLINEQTGLEVDHVVPVKRIPKTTSGKLQRHLLVESYLDGEFEAELRELDAIKTPPSKPLSTEPTSIAAKLKAICDAALPDRNIGLEDNLFDIGVSSLKLVEIHERLDKEFPGRLELTDVFEHPTIAALAERLATPPS